MGYSFRVGQARSECLTERERERNVLFNDALNTFYLRLYGVIHMVKDHSHSEKGNPLPPHRLLLSRVLLYAPSHRQDNTYHGLCYTSRGALAGTRECLTCTFRASCCSERLSRAQVSAFASSFVRDRE